MADCAAFTKPLGGIMKKTYEKPTFEKSARLQAVAAGCVGSNCK